MGRPLSENPKNKFLKVRMTSEEMEMAKKMADMKGLSVSDYVRQRIKDDFFEDTKYDFYHKNAN